MPRLFWKLFFALWLSIMAFAVVVSWINQVVIAQHTIEEPAQTLEAKLTRLEAKLNRDLKEGGERQLKRTLQGLPRGMRNNVFVLDRRGNDVSGRDRQLEKQKKAGAKTVTRQLRDTKGRGYVLVSTGRFQQRPLFAPGPLGVGMRLGVAAVISALVSLLLARYLAAPLGQLSRASRQLATGDLATRVGGTLDERRDEFGQLARDLDDMAGRLQLSQRANQRLLRDVSHELRSPLARLRVALEIARNKDESLIVEELNRIELESERLENLVDEVLGLLRESGEQQRLKISQFDLAELLQDLVETVNYESTDEAQLIELRARSPLSLDADRELLWRTFENLLRNALVHAGDAGVIQVQADIVSADEIQVSVCDSGPGIAEVHLERIFEPFYRVDEARSRRSGGYGLGLAIAASAVRRHGGRIMASNREAGGFEVRVTLPLVSSGA